MTPSSKGKGKAKRAPSTWQQDISKRAKKAEQDRVRRQNMSQEQREFVEEQRLQRLTNMSQADRDAYNSKQRDARAEMSQEDRNNYNSKQREARAEMSQEDRNNYNSKRREARAEMSQEARDIINSKHRDPDLERKRAYRTAYMRQWRAKKKAKKLYDAEMARIRSQEEDYVTLSAQEFRAQRETRRKVMADVEGRVAQLLSQDNVVDVSMYETKEEDLINEVEPRQLLRHLQDNEVDEEEQIQRHQNPDDEVPYDSEDLLIDPGVELTDDPQLMASPERPKASIRLEELNESTIPFSKLPGMTKRCSHCSAYLWPSEKKTEPCCYKGKIQLPDTDWSSIVTTDPVLLADIESLVEIYRKKNFCDSSRQYNSPFAFTSIGGDEVRFQQGGPPIYKIQGQMYHRLGSLLPNDDVNHTFAQVYLMECADQLQRRYDMNMVGGSSHDIQVIAKIQDIMFRQNYYAKHFYYFKENILGHPQEAFISIEARPGPDSRTYNAPKVAEVSVAMHLDQDTKGRDIIIFPKRGDRMRRVSETSAMYDPLQYPLLFPIGDSTGWNADGFCNSNALRRARMSCHDYYKFKLYRRKPFSPLHLAGKLALQFWTDMHCKVEGNRLQWFRYNQKEIRADKYQDFNDAVAGDMDLTSAGKRIILPATYTGSNRYMAKSYQDAMAIVRAFGRPDLFLTFTCNPKWEEIKEALQQLKVDANLSHNVPAHYNQDIINRVFRQKLQQLEDDINKNSIFGEVLAMVRVVEFQKRGLPHAHILIICKDKLENTRDIDGFISAEIPDVEIHPRLHELVKKNMMHSCDQRCIEDGVCKKRFPKDFICETTTDSDGYPLYRRRNTNPNNGRVVPYNPYLLLKYDAHINVEACTTVSSVKYLYKYVYKGPDRADVGVQVDDEITLHVSMRYVSATEAIWHMLKYPTQGRSHSVCTLPVHLPGQQAVIWTEDDVPQEVQNRAEATKLLEFFKVCADPLYNQGSNLRYIDMPQKYTWNVTLRKWTPRQRFTRTIGRMVAVSPKDEERFALRVLLCHRQGPKSFDDLKCVEHNGEMYHCSTFKEACEILGYLESDEEWHYCLAEASTYRMPSQIRALFATILIHCTPSNATDLYIAHFDAMAEDYAYTYRDRTSVDKKILIEGSTLKDIEEHLTAMGQTLRDFNLPQIPLEFQALVGVVDNPNKLLRDETNYNRDELTKTIEDGRRMATEEHRNFLDSVMAHVQNKTAKIFLLEGEGGSGKSFISQVVLAETRLRHNTVALGVASSGLAAQLLSGGRTAHSRFKIPVSGDEVITCNYSLSAVKDKHFCELMKAASVIIWDEISMVHKKLIEAVDAMLRDITKISQPFGSKVVIFSGDFKQVLPVIVLAGEQEIVRSTLPFSNLWSYIERFRLTQNMRLRRDTISDEEKEEITQFANFLVQVGKGETEPIPNLPGYVRLPQDIASHCDNEQSLNTFVRKIYGNISSIDDSTMATYIGERAILTPTNKVTDELNERILNMLSGESMEYLSADSVMDDNNDDIPENTALTFPVEFLNTLNFNGFPPHKLKLKVGVAIILLRNLCPSKGLCNGTRLIIKSLGQRVIEAEILSGQFARNKVLIPRISLIDNNAQKPLPFQLKRRQFPVRMAYAMTINKAQGQTLKHVGVFLPEPVFGHGQLYVALSRATSRKNLVILVSNGRKFQGDDNVYTKNIVYKDVLKALDRR